jgi:prepilin-type N-terminal cleavage/methylation domain-containing protein
MKRANNGGFSLVEMLVAIVILGLITIPMTSGMVVAMKTIARSEKMMDAQLAVSSAVEKLMATGISEPIDKEENGLKIFAEKENEEDPYYVVIVSHDSVEVRTHIREVGGDSP